MTQQEYRAYLSRWYKNKHLTVDSENNKNILYALNRKKVKHKEQRQSMRKFIRMTAILEKEKNSQEDKMTLQEGVSEWLARKVVKIKKKKVTSGGALTG